jgi:hypothetical protein
MGVSAISSLIHILWSKGMHHRSEQRSLQQQKNWLSWLWWPLAIILAALFLYQCQAAIRTYGLSSLGKYVPDDWLTQTLIAGLVLGLAEWIALWLIIGSTRRHWGIIIVTLASYLMTFPFTQDVLRLGNSIIPFYSGHPVRVMLLGAILTGLFQWGTLALLQALFLPLLLKVRWQYALLWMLVGALASMVAPAFQVFAELIAPSPTGFLPMLAKYSIYGIITGLPLIWLVPVPYNNANRQHGTSGY